MERLRCAWCGGPLSAVEMVEHRSLRRRQRWGWHLECYEVDGAKDRSAASWETRAVMIAARGPGRIGTIAEGAEELA